MIGFVLMALLLIAAGSALQILGFRLALEYDPQIARQLGNLHTAVELENLNAVYHARLKEIESEQRALLDKVKAFEAANAKLVETLTPSVVVRSRPQARAQGGVFKQQREGRSPQFSGSVLDALHDFSQSTRSKNHSLAERLTAWQNDIAWLESLPISLPVLPSNANLSSGFGERADPFSRRRAMHTGLDFELPMQTPVLAAGAGTVIEAGWDGAYGYTVVIRHRDDYTSRYAHASELLVREGNTVSKGQPIARSGNSGRSTGPHLHFEVLKNGQPIDPAQVLVVLNR